ncbi:hypothetical protein ELUMI_v1c00570 [Williamsoniiplasma luminosum]|uniref:Uncharacterized protein n=1 Tax=Williamsoniiplasma luminosum TaxID=214888 RepID=A0A2K8NSF8_9MOLU|nr:hypothetical protein [Williamsoniiplasma luminosum]ATZ16785.1 hypothetical protein ELUMI_v1c00570 [Williamsoniiplasma luminosum]
MLFTSLLFTALENNKIIGISLIVIGLLMTLLFVGLYFLIKKRSERFNSFRQHNRESKNVWDFTKKNFPLVLIVFGIMLFVAGLTMAIK